MGISWDPGLCLNWPEKFTCVLPELSKNLFLAKIQPCPWYLPFTIGLRPPTRLEEEAHEREVLLEVDLLAQDPKDREEDRPLPNHLDRAG